MTTDELKEYLKAVVDMERIVYLQKQIEQQISNHKAKFGVPNSFEKPSLDTSRKPGCGMIVVGGFVGLLLGSALGVFVGAEGAGGLLWGFFGLFVGGFVGQAIAEHSDETKKQSRYEQECENYENMVKADKQRVKRERVTIDFYNYQLLQLKKETDKAVGVLMSLYGMGILFPKYQNFVAVSSIYEYLQAGRCTTLEGHEGAYNIYETEIRLDRIINQLDEVIAHLEDIKSNQYIIYSAIQENNQTLHKILESNYRIEENVGKLEAQGSELNSRIADLQSTSALNLYFNELNHRELAYRRQWGI